MSVLGFQVSKDTLLKFWQYMLRFKPFIFKKTNWAQTRVGSNFSIINTEVDDMVFIFFPRVDAAASIASTLHRVLKVTAFTNPENLRTIRHQNYKA